MTISWINRAANLYRLRFFDNARPTRLILPTPVFFH
jgi:hypothetical protein